MGFGRDLLMASLFGNSIAADVFLFAYRFPALLRTLLIEEGFQAAFIPIYTELAPTKLTERQTTQQSIAQQEFTATILGAIITVTLIILLPIMIFMPEIMQLLAPDFKQRDQAFELLIILTRILFGYFLFLSISAVFINLLQAHQRFIAAAIMPIILSTILVGALILIALFPQHPWIHYWQDSIIWLALAVLLAGILQVIFIISATRLAALRFKFTFSKMMRPLLLRFLQKMLPVLLAKSTVQLNFLINQLLIVATVSGALSTFYYAERMMHLPIGIFIIAITTVLLPHLTTHIHQNNPEASLDAKNRAFIWAFFLSMPAMLAFMLLNQPLMLTLFQRGAFSVDAALKSALILLLFAPSIPFIGMLKIQTTILFAHQDTKTPMLVTLWGAGLNIILAITFIKLMSYPGAALASTLSLITQSFVFMFILHRRKLYILSPMLCKNFCKITLACIVMAGILFTLSPNIQLWIEYSFPMRFFTLLALIFIGFLAYMVTIILLGMFTFTDLKNFSKKT